MSVRSRHTGSAVQRPGTGAGGQYSRVWGARNAKSLPTGARAAFSIVDVLVSLAVIAVLISLLMPSLASVKQITYKVVCSNNLRHIGIATFGFSNDYRDHLPDSVFAAKLGGGSTPQPHLMMQLRTDEGVNSWDGLGLLYTRGYLDGPGVFYCPAHRGNSRLDAFANQWSGMTGVINGNYQYRGTVAGQSNLRRIAVMRPNAALISDGLASRADFNHGEGANVFRVDNTIAWFEDSDRQFISRLTDSVTDPNAATAVTQAWYEFDEKLSNWTFSPAGTNIP